MRLKSALRRGVAAAVIAGIVVSSGIPAYAAPWNIADGDITVKAGDTEGTNWVSQGEKEDVKDTDTVITGESDKNTVTIDTSKGDVDVTFDDLKIDVSGKTEVDGSGDGSTRESNAAVTVQGGGDATIELDGDNKLKSGSNNAGLEKNKQESKGTLTIKDDKGKDGSLTAEGGAGAAGIGDGVGAQQPEIDQDTPPSNPNNIIICGDAEVTAKAGRSQMLDAKAPAIGGKYGEVPTENLSDEEHKVTGGRLTRLNADGTVMEGMGYDYTSVPTPQPDDEDDDDDDVPPPAQENAPEPLPGGMVVGGFFSSRVTIRRLDPAGVAESGIVPVFGSVKASDAGEDLTSRDVVLIESAAPRSTVTTDIPSLREDGVEDIFFRYEDTMTHYSVDKMADAAGEDADVELKQNREDISLRLDGETRDDLSERYQEWVPVQTPEPQERLILTHKEVEQKTSEELRRELDESLKQLAARFEDIAPEEDKKPLLVLVEPSGTERKKYIDPLESDLRRYTDLSDDWDDLPDTQGEIKLWIPEDLEKAKLWIPEDLGHLISPSKESLSGIDGIA